MMEEPQLMSIKTEYDGYLFRSRLEARWAVFFNNIGLKYEYEKEGFNLDGLWYLPDFFLPDLNIWIEVKGKTPTKKDWNKLEKFAEKIDNILLLGNVPNYTKDWIDFREEESY